MAGISRTPPRRGEDRGLVGRRDLLALVARAADRARRARGGAVLLTGDGGIGKTAAVREAAARAEADGARVLWGTCSDGVGAPGYWPWIQVVRALWAADPSPGRPEDQPAFYRLVDGLRGSRPSSEDAGASAEAVRFQLFDEMTSVLLGAAERAPLVVVLDDLQWADPPSVLLASFLARRIAAARVLLLGAWRDADVPPDDPLRPALAELAAAGEVAPVAPLTSSQTAELMASILPSPPAAAAAEEVHRRTGGNPFFVLQLARLLQGSPGGSEPDAVPLGVRETLERRLAPLRPETLEALGTAAVIGTAFEPDFLAEALGRSVSDVRTLLAEAAVARIVVPPSDPPAPYRFAHDLFRETILQALDPEAVSLRHLAVGTAMQHRAERGADVAPGRLAHHFVAAHRREAAEQAVRSSALAAADATERRSHDESAAHWERAVRVTDAFPGAVPDGELPGLLLALAEARRRSGDLLGARQACFRAADRARRNADGPSLARAALELQASGGRSWPTMVDEIERALEEAADALAEGEVALRARVLAGLGRELAWRGRDLDRARALVDDAVRVARESDDPATLGECLVARHNVAWAPGNAVERVSVADEIVARSMRTGDRELEAEGRLLRVADLLERADPRWHDELSELLVLVDALRQPRFRYAGLCRRAMRALLQGDLPEAEELVEAAAALGREIGEPDVEDVRLAQLWEIRTLQGRRRELLDDARRFLPEDSPQRRSIEVLCLAEAGDRAAAAAHLAPLLRVGPGTLPRDRSWMTAMSFAVELAASVFGEDGGVPPADRASAETILDLLVPYAGDVVVTGVAIVARGAMAHHLGTVAALLGRGDEAAAYLEGAIVRHQSLGAAPWALASRFALATLRLAADGSSEQARAELADVAASASRIGMAELAAHAAGRLREAEDARRLRGTFRRAGGRWTLMFDGTTAEVTDAKGLQDLAALLARPGAAIPAVDLAAASSGGPAELAARRMGSDEVLDDRARREVRARLDELDREIDQAESWNDGERAARARAGRDALVHELTVAAGLGGRPRRLGDESERARKAVTARIRDAIARIAAVHAALGTHLEDSIHTGSSCSYTPAVPVAWQL